MKNCKTFYEVIKWVIKTNEWACENHSGWGCEVTYFDEGVEIRPWVNSYKITKEYECFVDAVDLTTWTQMQRDYLYELDTTDTNPNPELHPDHCP